MNDYINALIVSPNEISKLIRITNSLDEFRNIIGLNIGEMASVNLDYFTIFFPAHIDIKYCLIKGIIPDTFIILKRNRSNFTNLENIDYLSISSDEAYRFLARYNFNRNYEDQTIGIEIDSKIIFSILEEIVSNTKISIQAKGLFSFLLISRVSLGIEVIKEACTLDEPELSFYLNELIEHDYIMRIKSESFPGDRYNIPKSLVDHHTYLEEINEDTSENEQLELHISETLEEEDKLLEESIRLVRGMKSASVSLLQRRLRIGYTRAARLIDRMEQLNIVGPYEGSKPREVIL